jgi:hypothetical protein
MPGIGKTTLAQMLLYYYYYHQKYQMISIVENLSEATKLHQEATSQIFYYDDFLGSTCFRDNAGNNQDTKLVRFINTIKRSEHHKLILTTRDHILQTAKDESEKLNTETVLADDNRFVLNLADYSGLDKGKILYNHIYFSKLLDEYKQVFLETKPLSRLPFYREVLSHPNFIPRLIESFTDVEKTKHIAVADYKRYIMAMLDNPEAVFEHAFNKQLTTEGQCVLLSLFLSGEPEQEDKLHNVWGSVFTQWKNQYSCTVKPNSWTIGLKEVLGSWIVTSSYSNQHLRFTNPSIIDFLKSYLSKHPEVSELLLKSCLKIEHIHNLINRASILNKNCIPNTLLDSQLSIIMGQRTLELNNKNYSPSYNDLLLVPKIMSLYSPHKEVEQEFIGLIRTILTQQNVVFLGTRRSFLLDFLKLVEQQEKTEFNVVYKEVRSYLLSDLRKVDWYSLILEMHDFLANSKFKYTKQEQKVVKQRLQDWMEQLNVEELEYIDELEGLESALKYHDLLDDYADAIRERIDALKDEEDSGEEERDDEDRPSTSSYDSIEELFNSLR